MRPMKKSRYRALLALLGTAALMVTSATTAMATGGEASHLDPGGVVTAKAAAAPMMDTAAASDSLDVLLSVDVETVVAGRTIFANWNIDGGVNPTVTQARVGSGIADGAQMFFTDWSDPVQLSAGRIGTVALTVPAAGDRAFVYLAVNDDGVEYEYLSEVITVTGFTGYDFSDFGAVLDFGADEAGVGFYDRGSIKKGWFSVFGYWFHANAQGFMKLDEWLNDQGKWYYFADTGVMQTGWLHRAEGWYYLNTDGAMQTGWVKSGTSWYYLDATGMMQTGWVKAGGSWYHLNTDGSMQTGWVKDAGSWYYLKADGAMATGWVQVGGSWYYLEPGGQMVTGWVQAGGAWYYLNAHGSMLTGWLQQGNSWYYLKPNGAMVTGQYRIDGRLSNFAGSGVWLGYASSGSGSGSGSGGGVLYKNCSEVRRAGKAPLYRGQPGYGEHLDRDGDGVACERR
ncbi:MAG: excalibur calcium-binding domain-containing protein [Propioniciclava sp.]